MGDLALYGHAGGIGGATHPDFQGRGLYQSLHGWREEREDPPLTMNLVSRARDPRATKYERLPFGKSMGVYLRVLRPWRAAADRGGFVPPGAVAFAAMMLWGRLREGSGGKEAGITVSELPAFDERFEPFWERASAAWDVIPVRSVELLNWRFCDPRAGDFSIRIAEENGALLGYVVLHLVSTRGYVMDLLALPGRLDVVRRLIDDAVHILHEAGASAVECWMLREHPYAGVLRRARFVLLRRRSARETSLIGLTAPDASAEERALIASPRTPVHLVRADFDGI